MAQNVDGRSAWARRLKDLIHLYLQDLGGIAKTTQAQQALVRRAAIMQIELERMESRFAQKDEASRAELETFQRVTNSLRRTLECIGLERKQSLELKIRKGDDSITEGEAAAMAARYEADLKNGTTLYRDKNGQIYFLIETSGGDQMKVFPPQSENGVLR